MSFDACYPPAPSSDTRASSPVGATVDGVFGGFVGAVHVDCHLLRLLSTGRVGRTRPTAHFHNLDAIWSSTLSDNLCEPSSAPQAPPINYPPPTNQQMPPLTVVDLPPSYSQVTPLK